LKNPSTKDKHHRNIPEFSFFVVVSLRPTFKGDSEVSVYDLKDHPDFQYRPGTIVIRVANFIGEDSSCTAGQVIDNYPEGRVKVWWVDGHVSLCWPQDLFEVKIQYDQKNGGK
jgi:ubiquitin-conjugating enzyme E2 O